MGFVCHVKVAVQIQLLVLCHDCFCNRGTGCCLQGRYMTCQKGLMPRDSPYCITIAELLSFEFWGILPCRKDNPSASKPLSCQFVPYELLPQPFCTPIVLRATADQCQSHRTCSQHKPPRHRLERWLLQHPVGLFAFLLGCRVGEALNPGPDDRFGTCSSTIAIVNPTCIANKGQTLLDLSHQFKVDTFVASETAATVKAQSQLAQVIRPHGFRSVWSAPMANQFSTVAGCQSLRGRAGGVACLSQLPMRHSHENHQWKDQFATRILHCILRLGHLDLQIVVIYGLPSSAPGSRDFNNQLLTLAVEAVKSLPLPSIIIGDFNMLASDFDLFPHLQSLGWHDLLEWHLRVKGSEMPPSSKNATNPDNAILCPRAVALLLDVQVLGDDWFDTHRPVLFRLSCPQQAELPASLKQPRSWGELPVDANLIQQAYQRWTPHLCTPSTIEQWGHKVERVVDLALKDYHTTHPEALNWGTYPGLPKPYRGRCQPPKVRNKPMSFVKEGRHGLYAPNCEVHSLSTARKIRQLRRIQALRQKLAKQQFPARANLEQFWSEWQAICRSRDFGTAFLKWLAHWPEAPQVALHLLPSPSDLWDVEQLVRFQVDKVVRADQKIWQAKQKYIALLDQKDLHHRNQFARTKGPSKPAVRELVIHPQATVSLITQVPLQETSSTSTGNVTWEVHGPDLKRFTCGPAKIDQRDCTIVAIHDSFLHLMSPADNLIGPGQYVLSQEQFAFTHTELCQHLTCYWKQYWQREPLIDQDTGDQLAQMIMRLPPEELVPINELDPQLWEATVKTLRSHAATGVDAISAYELKMLPTALIMELAAILCAYTQGFPRWYMAARAIPLPKCWGQLRPDDTRPITILSQTYRLWSKVINAQILSTFASRCPPDVTGFLRQRDARSAAYRAQWHIEQARINQLPLSGVTLDLKKCFNLIDRQRVSDILQRLGIPGHLLHQWLASLAHFDRFWDLAGLVSDLVPSFTGLPEGDCWSVTAMIGIAWIWANELRQVIAPIVPAIRLSVSAYADNWSWQSNDHQIHVELFRATHRVALCLGLEIDHSKTWQWATSQQGVSLMSTALQANPWPVRLQSVIKAKDLGTPMVYQGRAGTSMLPDRESEAVQRLQRIEWSCRSLHDKVHQIRASVYPVAFHGSEVGVIATAQLDNLRNQVVQAVFHKVPSMNSAIAFQLIDENLLDPALFAILLSIKMAQRFLHHCSPEEQQTFLKVAATAKGTAGHIWGPASALKANLLRIGWGVSRDGSITSPHLIPLSIIHDSFAKLQRFAKASWEVDFFLHFTQRKNLTGYPDISHRLTTRALKKFPGATHVRLVRELAGGFQTKEQQSKWDTQVSSQCELCQFEDSRYHRIFDCPATQSVRARFAPVCNFDQWVEAEWHETAGIMIPRLQSLAQALVHNLPEPEVPAFVRQHVLHSGTRVAFYTDGSCQCPEQMPFSTAASALIMDLCQSDTERIWQANNWLTTRSMPQSLVRIWTAQCPGEQSIHRAELHALVKACEQLSQVDLYSDCQNAIDAVYKAQSGTLQLHPDVDHLDLLRRLQQAPGLLQVRVRKIKAHLSPELVSDPLLRYHTLGNQLANDWAQRRSLDQNDPVNAELLLQMRDIRQQRLDLDAFLQYVAALQLERQTQLDLLKLTGDEPIPSRCREQGLS